MLEILGMLLVAYMKDVVILYILFALFNAVINGVGFNVNALYLGNDDRNIVLVVPVAYVVISLLGFLPIIGFLFSGFLGTVLSLVAFVLIFAHFKGLLRR